MSIRERDARESLRQFQEATGLHHLKEVVCKYIEMEGSSHEADRDAPFEVICAVLGLSAAERKRLLAARPRKPVGGLMGLIGA